ncbi:hypothetical protein OC835_006685 [Tilletia horrida]|nr:hypothetical protein OC835_006685 [Tilletia horrida]KAK0562748.1 hypothetical protein OC844_002555 [Tilletia horrida]
MSSVAPTLGELPGEILLRVANYYLEDSSDFTYPSDWLQHIASFASVNRRFRAAIQHELGHQFHMISPASSRPLPIQRASERSWLPGYKPKQKALRAYWRQYLGFAFDEPASITFQLAWARRIPFIALKALSLDLRVVSVPVAPGGDPAAWNHFQAPQWINAAAILSRIASTATELEQVHVRIASQTEQIMLLQDLVRANPNVKSLIIEVDSALDLLPATRAIIDLDSFCDTSMPPHTFQRFVLRAPACEIVLPPRSTFLRSLTVAQEVRIAAYRIEVPGQPWQWCVELLRTCAKATAVELSSTRGNSQGQTPPFSLQPVATPHLLELTMDLPEVDARFLRLLHAPELAKLRINTRTRIDEWGHVDPFHFPALKWICIRCYSPSASRIETLGIPPTALSVISTSNAEWRQVEFDFVADIRVDHLAQQPLHQSPSATSTRSPSSLWLHSPHSTSGLILLDPSSVPSASPATMALQSQSADQAGDVDPVPASPSMSALATPNLRLSPASDPNFFANSVNASSSSIYTLPPVDNGDGLAPQDFSSTSLPRRHRVSVPSQSLHLPASPYSPSSSPLSKRRRHD